MADNHFADIILPFAIKGAFTYRIPEGLSENVIPGMRVLVQFGRRKLYSGIVYKIHNEEPSGVRLRSIISVLDSSQVTNEIQLKFWFWISEYYMCSVGEVMKTALPSDLCLEGVTSVAVVEKYKAKGETFIKLAEDFTESELNIILNKLARAPAQENVLTGFLRLSVYTEGQQAIPVKKSMLLRQTGSSPGIIDALIKKHIFASVIHRNRKAY